MKKKSILSFLLAVTLLLTMFGCSGGQSPSSGKTDSSNGTKAAGSESSAEPAQTNVTDAPVTLNVWVAGSGDPVYDSTYRSVFDAFTKENPNVSYELTFIPWADYFTKLNTGLAGGAGPDMFMLGYGQMGTVQSMGYLLNLDSYIPADWDGWDDFLPSVLNICKKDGSMYGMFAASTRVYMYRKDIAQQQGVTQEELHVTSLEELMSLGRKLTVKNESGKTTMSGLSVTTSQNSPEQQFFVNMTYQQERPLLWDDNAAAAFQTEAGVKAVEELRSLVQDGTALSSDPNNSVSELILGTSAMQLSSEGAYKEIEAANPGNIGILDCDLPSLLIGDYFAVNGASKNKEAAVQLLLHTFSKESCEKFATGMGRYSGRTSLDEAYIAMNPEYEYVVKTFQNAVSYSTSMNPTFNKMVSYLRTALEEIYAGADAKTRLEAAAQEYQAEVG